MGKLTIRQKGKKFNVNIYSGNALAIFICEYKQNDEERYVMYNFFADKKHCDNIIKNDKRLFSDEVVSIELNLYYRKARSREPRQKSQNPILSGWDAIINQ